VWTRGNLKHALRCSRLGTGHEEWRLLAFFYELEQAGQDATANFGE
jgi:hypothetical protein